MQKELALDIQKLSKSFAMHHRKSDSLKEYVTQFLKQNKKSTHHTALSNFSMQIYRGEAVGIIGKNGAGKSTLLKILSGIMPPDSGRIDFYGKTVSILDIGTGFHPELTGRENVYFSAALYGFTKSEIEHHIESILAFSDIGAFVDEPVKNYSSGMYLRLAFSIVAFLDADIYLVDEVIQVGDANFQTKCKTKLDELIRKGKTLVIASHNMNDIAMLCQRIVYIDNGEIVAEGGWDVIQQYVSTAVSQFNNLKEHGYWKARQIETVKRSVSDIIIRGVKISDCEVNEHGIVFSEPIAIDIGVELLSDSLLDIGLRFFNSTGVMVFGCSTYNNELKEPLLPGPQTVRFTIPAHLLNRGIYYADLLVVKNMNEVLANRTDEAKMASIVLQIEKALAFQITDIVNNGKPEITYGGIVKPQIPVQIIK